jgi:hypothetical protein
MDIQDVPSKKTPPDGTFSYRSVVAMLQYLQSHSRPDITYAGSQCARLIHSPRRSHEEALIGIGQYLKGIIDKGLVFRSIKRQLIVTLALILPDFGPVLSFVVANCSMKFLHLQWRQNTTH